MPKCVLFFLLPFLIYTNIRGASIKGKVVDAKTKEPLCCGVNVIVEGTLVGANTDANGFYLIENLQPGDYAVRTTFIGYERRIDSVSISSNDTMVELNIELVSGVDFDSVTTPQLKAYHKRIKELNENTPVLKLFIDSLDFRDNYVYAYISMMNCSAETLFVLKSYPCFSVINAAVYDTLGEKISPNSMMIDCVGEKVCPDEGDLIEILPGAGREYPCYKIWNFSFEFIPKGKYSVKMRYVFEAEGEISKFYCKESNLAALTTALRGCYISENKCFFIN